jgi:mono/diheme cytochrome c family protein
MIRLTLATLAVVTLYSAGLCASAVAEQSAADGAKVYASQKCSICHAIAGKGNPKGSLDGVGSKYTSAELRQWIVSSAEMAAKHKATRTPAMKDFSKLPPKDVDALVAYLSTLTK